MLEFRPIFKHNRVDNILSQTSYQENKVVFLNVSGSFDEGVEFFIDGLLSHLLDNKMTTDEVKHVRTKDLRDCKYQDIFYCSPLFRRKLEDGTEVLLIITYTNASISNPHNWSKFGLSRHVSSVDVFHVGSKKKDGDNVNLKLLQEENVKMIKSSIDDLLKIAEKTSDTINLTCRKRSGHLLICNWNDPTVDIKSLNKDDIKLLENDNFLEKMASNQESVEMLEGRLESIKTFNCFTEEHLKEKKINDCKLISEKQLELLINYALKYEHLKPKEILFVGDIVKSCFYSLSEAMQDPKYMQRQTEKELTRFKLEEEQNQRKERQGKSSQKKKNHDRRN